MNCISVIIPIHKDSELVFTAIKSVNNCYNVKEILIITDYFEIAEDFFFSTNARTFDKYR